VGEGATPGDVAHVRVMAMLERARAARIPLSGSIAMTHRCHLRCLHCYLGDERQAGSGPRERKTGFWLSLVDEVADAGCLNLLITGGEPLLRRDFALVYERAARRGILVTVFTNGTLVDERLLALFAELTPEMVEVTLYGASAEVYERVTGVPGSHRRCLDGVDALVARGLPVTLKAVVMRENVQEVQAMRRLAAARGLSFRIDGALFPCRDGCPAPLEHRVPPEQTVALEMEDEALLRLTADYFRRVRGSPPEQRLFACGAGLTGFHVDPEGTLWPCLMARTHGFDLRGGSFREGWDTALPGFREQAVEPGYQCHSCERRFLCGLCPAQAGLETGSTQRKADYYCALGEARFRAIAALLGE
jgi:radical SAM protein with 4Fe4S-binding SPASM domain